MTAADMPGLDVSSRVRARDIQMAGVADLRRRVLMITGAIDTVDHDISLGVNLPEPGRWQVVKSHTNLTDQTWVAIQEMTDENSTFVEDEDSMIMARQFAKSFMTPDHRRLTFYDGEVRPGEALLKMYTLETSGNRPSYSYSAYSPLAADSATESSAKVEQMLTDGFPRRPVIELIIPVMVIG
ncbi:MAG TPA: DUF6423 family protein [Streptosporangiaceae bacterium]